MKIIETNLDEVKTIAKIFVFLDVKETEMSPMFVIHPVFESGYISIKNDNGEMEIVNVLESEDNLDRARKQIVETIDRFQKVSSIVNIIRKSYRLTFLSYCKPYLSKEDFSKLLADVWVASESPNDDVNVSIAKAVQYFKYADKKVLMDENEYAAYKEFPDTLTVYRGVGVSRNPEGISWTIDKDKAIWFAHRFDIKGKSGYLLEAEIKKEDILAYFKSRGEEEIVVKPRKETIKKIEL